MERQEREQKEQRKLIESILKKQEENKTFIVEEIQKIREEVKKKIGASTTTTNEGPGKHYKNVLEVAMTDINKNQKTLLKNTKQLVTPLVVPTELVAWPLKTLEEMDALEKKIRETGSAPVFSSFLKSQLVS